MDTGWAMSIYNKHTEYNSSHIATAVEFTCDDQISWQQCLNQLKKKQLASMSQDKDLAISWPPAIGGIEIVEDAYVAQMKNRRCNVQGQSVVPTIAVVWSSVIQSLNCCLLAS